MRLGAYLEEVEVIVGTFKVRTEFFLIHPFEPYQPPDITLGMQFLRMFDMNMDFTYQTQPVGLLRWAVGTSVVALCCTVSGCWFQETIDAAADRAEHAAIEPKLTEYGKGVQLKPEDEVKTCTWIGDEDVKVSRFTQGAGELRTQDMIDNDLDIVARNSAQYMGGDTIVEAESPTSVGEPPAVMRWLTFNRPTSNFARYDVFKCGF